MVFNPFITYLKYLIDYSQAARWPVTREGFCQAWLSTPYLPISEGRKYKKKGEFKMR